MCRLTVHVHVCTCHVCMCVLTRALSEHTVPFGSVINIMFQQRKFNALFGCQILVGPCVVLQMHNLITLYVIFQIVGHYSNIPLQEREMEIFVTFRMENRTSEIHSLLSQSTLE